MDEIVGTPISKWQGYTAGPVPSSAALALYEEESGELTLAIYKARWPYDQIPAQFPAGADPSTHTSFANIEALMFFPAEARAEADETFALWVSRFEADGFVKEA